MAVDLYWTLDGDYEVGRDGDLRDTKFDDTRSMQQEIRTRLQSSFYDWATWPNGGANLQDLLGRPNNKLTAEEAKSRVISSLTQDGFLVAQNIKVRYLPVARDQIIFFIECRVKSTSIVDTRTIKTMIIYDTDEGSLRVI